MSSEKSKSTQRVIMVILDTLMDKPLQHALKDETLPAFKYFMDHAEYYPNVVTPFPSMSVNVESTLLTGTYSEQHHVPALAWYSQNENRIINYGTHVFELMKLGLSNSVYDAIYRLNHQHLSSNVKTIHEELHEQGKETASINPLMHRGAQRNTMTVPALMRFFLAIKKQIDVYSPAKFSYGRLSKMSPLNTFSSIWHKYGFNNHFSIQEFSHIVKEQDIPHFSLVYLPDHDKNVHKHGPMDMKGIKDMDQQLQTLLDTFPSWDDALKNYTWVLIGDNGQSQLTDQRERVSVDLRKVMAPFKVAKLRKGVQKDAQVVLAINLRSAFIYTLNPNDVTLEDIVEKLQTDSRIEIIAWKEEGWINVTSSKNKNSFKFKEKGIMKDPYNQTWEIDGDHSILDLKIEGKGIEFDDFPDALKRIQSALHSHEGEFVVATVKPEYEFIGESTPKHVGGASHGGLHKNDSNIPMIVTGTKTTPEFLRMIDLKKWILNLINTSE
ncbi:alkaline phosphatase family protein [Bacillus shivajii]|uniref:alkaline phosphatase family protein n=1 Tax=Bacillus shivajii TaxID=1983719 RepID=UPI001CFBC6FE|nr:alkaline phosphatase family protein [Bacillus shivajii]UCZ54142.1 alkaline phosphatase family protein [Bacillus shivajii]